jgi:hypothetical protein
MMRIETVPLILGVLLGLFGLLLAADAWIPDGTIVPTERRRRQRAERNTTGEGLIAIGMLAEAAAIIGRDTWKSSTIAVIAGVIALGIGSFLNLNFLREYVFHRGRARRSPEGAPPEPKRPSRPVPGQKGPQDRAPDQPPRKPTMKDNRQHPRG